jgi:hypothetical protein
MFVDYFIDLYNLQTMGFWDQDNSSNNIADLSGSGLAYYNQSNNNKTIEIGYKLKTSHMGKGYLDLSFGQTIKVKISVGDTTDYAPNAGLDGVSYTLTDPSNGKIPGFSSLITVIGFFMAIGLYLRKKTLIK